MHVLALADDREEQRCADSAAAYRSHPPRPTINSWSAPLVTVSSSRSMPAKALNAVPVEARQREQWQLAEYRNAVGHLVAHQRRTRRNPPACSRRLANDSAAAAVGRPRVPEPRDMKNVGTSQIRRNATSSDVDAPCRSSVNPSTTTSTRQKMRYAPVKRTSAAVCSAAWPAARPVRRAHADPGGSAALRARGAGRRGSAQPAHARYGPRARPASGSHGRTALAALLLPVRGHCHRRAWLDHSQRTSRRRPGDSSALRSLLATCGRRARARHGRPARGSHRPGTSPCACSRT